MGKTAVFTGCNEAYLPGAVATVRSLRRHHPDVDAYCIVPPALVAQADETFQGAARAVSVPRALAGVHDRMQMNFARLFAAEFGEYEVVVWLDSDTVVCRSIAEFLAVTPGRVNVVDCYPSNRVHNVLPMACRPVFATAFPTLTGVPGFNSGVMAFRPADWPDLVGDMERLIARVGFDAVHPFCDQALLNGLFLGKTDVFPFEYNWTEMFDSPPAEGGVRIAHYCSRPKPWEPGYPQHEPGYWFWVKHGLGETDSARLRAVRRRILLHTPRRRLGQLVRRLRAGAKG